MSLFHLHAWVGLQRFWHCLTKFHRGERMWDSRAGGLMYLGCECGRVFYGERPWFFQPRAPQGHARASSPPVETP